MTALKLTALLFLCSTFEISFIDAFRSDYYYIDSTRAYYKFHKECKNWADAGSTCQSEGALHFYPENKPELDTVLSVLGVGNNNGGHFWIGISDLKILKVYKTVDGRPINQIYNEWNKEWTNSDTNNQKRCVGFFINDLLLFVDNCTRVGSFICKHQNSGVTVTPATKEVIGNSNDKLPGANQTAAFEVLERHLEAMQQWLAESIQEQTDNQTKALQLVLKENQSAALQQSANQTKALKQLEENQTAALQQFTKYIQEQAANQSTALEQLVRNQMTAFQKLAEDIHQQSLNQTAALERQALAPEKQAGSFPAYSSALHILAAPNYKVILTRDEDNNEIDARYQS